MQDRIGKRFSLILELVVQAGKRTVDLLVKRFDARSPHHRSGLIGVVTRNVEVERALLVPYLFAGDRQVPDRALSLSAVWIDFNRFAETDNRASRIAPLQQGPAQRIVGPPEKHRAAALAVKQRSVSHRARRLRSRVGKHDRPSSKLLR